MKIILKGIYSDKVFPSTLQKWTMKKLNIDAFTIPAFNFNRKFYKQIDYGFTVRSFFGQYYNN